MKDPICEYSEQETPELTITFVGATPEEARGVLLDVALLLTTRAGTIEKRQPLLSRALADLSRALTRELA